MNSILTKAFIFVGGAAVGAAASWKLLKTHFERITQEEIDSVKEYYSTRFNKSADEEEVGEEKTEDTTTEESEKQSELNHRDYAAILAKKGYTKYTGVTSTVDKVYEAAPSEGPYVIAPEEFGEHEGYDRISLTYYADGVVADELDVRVDNVDEIIGIESLNTFGDYEEDSVFVRNDELKADYEILASLKRYSEVVEV